MGLPQRQSSFGRARRALVALAAFAAALCALPLSGEPTTEAIPSEYEAKVVFLYKLTKFVDWPPLAFEDAKSPLVVGVLGKDPFGSLLEDAFKEEAVNGRRVVVRRFGAKDDLRSCHLLFISSSEKERLPEVLAQLDARPVLTVGETDGFAARGGMIQLAIVEEKVRFDGNPPAAERCGLKISSKLLKLARHIVPK